MEAEEIEMRGDLIAVTPVAVLAADAAEDDIAEGDVVLEEDASLDVEKEALVEQTSPIAITITKNSKNLVLKAVLLCIESERSVTVDVGLLPHTLTQWRSTKLHWPTRHLPVDPRQEPVHHHLLHRLLKLATELTQRSNALTSVERKWHGTYQRLQTYPLWYRTHAHQALELP